jgi:hypothetical protein
MVAPSFAKYNCARAVEEGGEDCTFRMRKGNVKLPAIRLDWLASDRLRLKIDYFFTGVLGWGVAGAGWVFTGVLALSKTDPAPERREA